MGGKRNHPFDTHKDFEGVKGKESMRHERIGGEPHIQQLRTPRSALAERQVVYMTAVATQIEPFVGTEEVAAFLGKPPSWLYNRAERLGIPRYRVGLHYRYRLSEVAAWVGRSKLGESA